MLNGNVQFSKVKIPYTRKHYGFGLIFFISDAI